MSPATLERIIDERVQAYKEKRLIIISNCENIEYCIVWNKVDSSPFMEPDDIYFIKRDSNEYVGAVQKMSDGDILCFVKEEHRGKGYAYNSLSKFILPHIYSESDDDGILCTFATKEGLALGKKLGFDINDDKGVLNRDKINMCPEFIPFEPLEINSFIEPLQNEIQIIINRLKLIKDHYEYAGLHNEAKDISKAISNLLNI